MRDKREEILNTIATFPGDEFLIESNSSNSIYTITKESDDQFKKFIIFENSDAYRNVKDYIRLLTDIEEERLKNYSLENILRIPFFAGCSGYDLGIFLIGEKVSLNKKLDFRIDFKILPSDFNLTGLERFANYLAFKQRRIPIFKSNDNFSGYRNYFVDKIKENQWKLNQVLPSKLEQLYPDNVALSQIFTEIRSKAKENS